MSRGKTGMKNPGGYLTVYLALTVSILLSLILTLFTGARVGAVRMKTEFVADIAMNSILAEYHRELLSQYGLLMNDISYGSSDPSVINIEEHLDRYVMKNFEVTGAGFLLSQVTLMRAIDTEAHVTGYSLAPDNGNAVMKRAIYKYMTAGMLDDASHDAGRNVEELQEYGYDSTDVEELASGYDEQLSKKYTVVNEEGVTQEMYPDPPSAAVTQTKGIGILTLAAGDLDISDIAVDETIYYSHRTGRLHGTGLSAAAEGGLLDRLLFDQYCGLKCGSFGKELDKSLLKYQVEYLIAGTGSDWTNLERVCEIIFGWREAANLAYLLSDETKIAQVEALAATASILITMPELYEAIKWSIICAWSFAESVNDLYILLHGGKVPMAKSADSWMLSIENMINYRDSLGGGCGYGLEYTEYLFMVLMLENYDTKVERIMDLMEMDIRLTPGNGWFRIDGCMDVFCAEITVRGKSGGTHRVERIYGYE